MSLGVRPFAMAVRASNITLGNLCSETFETGARGADARGVADVEQLSLWVAVIEIEATVIILAAVHTRLFVLADDPSDLGALHMKVFIGGHAFNIH